MITMKEKDCNAGENKDCTKCAYTYTCDRFASNIEEYPYDIQFDDIDGWE